MKTLVVLLGPTAVGKTELSLRIAERLGSPILNADSRQIFRGMPIGTAAPTPEEQKRVKHYFVEQLDVDQYYSAAQYETDVMQLTQRLFETHDTLLMSGGSMMYIDAVCKGIDDIPTIRDDVRDAMKLRLQNEGLDALMDELRALDPEYAQVVDSHNTRRVIHALEICHQTGRPYSAFRVRNHKQRPFRILKVGLQRPREELFARINRRVELMVANGLIDEVRSHLCHREYNALNTVGYKEMFMYLDGVWDLSTATARIQKNTRVYAKKQMTWFAKDEDIQWFHPDDEEKIMKYITENQ